jgi:hypothetical protein
MENLQEDQQSVGDGGIGDEQLSPNSSLRRSSRVSALKAKQKLQQHSTQQPQGPTTSLTDHPAASTVAATATIPPVQPPSQEPKQQQQQQQQLSVALSPKEELQPNPKTKLAGAVEMVSASMVAFGTKKLNPILICRSRNSLKTRKCFCPTSPCPTRSQLSISNGFPLSNEN